MTTAPIRLGVAGLGRGFLLSLPTLVRHPAFVITAAAEPRPAARDAFAGQFGCPAYADFGDMLSDPDVDAIYIASPHGLHAEQTIAAATAGKHILVEKPMAVSVQQCRDMESAAKRAGVVLVVGPSHGFDAPVDLAEEIIASGIYGAAKMVTAFNFTDFLYRLRRPEELDSTKGGGIVYSQAAHQFDIVCRLMGQPVRSVRAIIGAWDAERPSEGAYNAIATFAGGGAASMTYSGYAHYDSDELVGWISELGFPKDPDDYGMARRRLRDLGDQDEASAKAAMGYGTLSKEGRVPPAHHEHFGFVLVSCEAADLRLTPQGIWVYANEERKFLPLPAPDIPRSGAFDEFAAAIRGERAAKHDGAWGAHILACCEALLRSSADHKEISLS